MLPTLDTDLLRAFMTVADAKSFTRAGLTLHRTQAAVSMQIKRLEEVVGRRLFDRNGRSVTLTSDGTYLLAYARRMLRLNDEAMSRFAGPALEGVVRVGAPDDYALYLLPEALALFAQTHPKVRVEVVCENSVDLVPEVASGQLDLALVSRHPDSPGGMLVRREPLLWVTSARHLTHEQEPLPLALYPQGCVCRDLALDALDAAGRDWHLAYASRSVSAIQGAVTSGFALSVMEKSTLPPEIRVLGEADGFPSLPDVEIALHCTPGDLPPPAARLAEHIMESLGSG